MSLQNQTHAPLTMNQGSLATFDGSLLHLTLKVSLCGEKSKLTHKDLKHISQQDLPPKELATLGRKRILPENLLESVKNIRKNTKMMLNELAIAFDGGWIVPEDQLLDILDNLIKLKNDFESEKEYFFSEYHKNINEFLNEFAQWKHILDNSIPTLDLVEKKFIFRWALSYILPRAGYNLSLQKNTITHQSLDISAQMIDEISLWAQQIENTMYIKSNKIKWDDMVGIQNIAEKLQHIAFVKNEITPLASLITAFLSLFASKGVLNDYELEILSNFLPLFKDKTLFNKCLTEIIRGETSIEFLVKSLMPVREDVVNTEVSLEENSPKVGGKSDSSSGNAGNFGLW